MWGDQELSKKKTLIDPFMHLGPDSAPTEANGNLSTNFIWCWIEPLLLAQK